MTSTNKKDFVCWNPFTYMEIHENGLATMCCPAWISETFDAYNLKEEWGSEKAWAVRNSIKDGSYKYCNEKFCPVLTAIREGRADYVEQVTPETFNWTEDKLPPMKHVKFCFDTTCNLYCKTCREQRIVYTGKKREEVDSMMARIERDFGDQLELIDVSGSGEVFFSKTFRDWLLNFDPEKYPKLQNIHIHTNGIMWTESFWERVTLAKPFVHSAEVSIDGACKETYEKIRRGGTWERLVKNLEYIATLPLETITCSFVVQRDNYREIEAFYEFVKGIFENSGIEWKVMYGRVGDWGRLTREHWEEVNIFADPEAEKEIIKTVEQLAKSHGNVLSNL